jgi:hypothetical protein
MYDTELHHEPLFTEDNRWAGMDRKTIFSEIKHGMVYLNTTDLVALHSEISSIQISRNHSHDEEPVVGI